MILWFIRFICKFAALPAIGGTLVAFGLTEVLGSAKLGIGAGILSAWVAYAAGYRAAESNPITVLYRVVRDLYGTASYWQWRLFTEEGRNAP